MNEASRLVAGRYRLGTRLGSGAMGIVWQALDERLHRTVAVKQLLLQPGLSTHQAEQARQRALREGRIAARLQHAGAVTVHDVVTDDGDPWLIMEYLPSQSLAKVLDERGTLPPHRVANIGAQAAAALTAAHAAGIVHRDVKPGNVLLGSDDLVKITDFGISRAIGDVTVTATGILAGTPAYLAPELAQGAEPKPPSDVYALGATLYTAVEGVPPCGRSDNPLALLHAVAAGRITPPRQAGPLTAVLMALLRTDPAQRPSMSDVREALSMVASDRVVPSALLSPAGAEATAPQRTEPVFSEAAHGEQSHGAAVAAFPPREPTRQGPPPWSQPVAAAAAGSRNARTKRVLLTMLAIAVAIAVGIGVASLFLGGANNNAQQSTSSQAAAPAPRAQGDAPGGQQQQKQQPVQRAPAQPGNGPATADEVRKTIKDYYRMLPENTAGAFALLSQSQQASSGGRSGYEEFWSSIESVKARKVTPTGAGKATVELRFETEDNRSEETYSITVSRVNGQLLITDSGFVSAGG